MSIAVAATYINTWTGTTATKTASVTVAAGDLLVILCRGSSTAATFSASGGSPALTYTNKVSKNVTYGSTAIITAPSSGAQTFTLTVTRAGNTFVWGCIVLRLTGTDQTTGASVGYSDNATGNEFTTLTTDTNSSAIAVILGDADSGGPVTWDTSSAGAFTSEGTTDTTLSNYPGIYLNAGTAGSKTVGLTSPVGSFSSNISALEIHTGSISASANLTEATGTGAAQNFTVNYDSSASLTDADATAAAQATGGSADSSIAEATATSFIQALGYGLDAPLTGAAATGASQTPTATYDGAPTLTEADAAASAPDAGGSSDSAPVAAAAVVAGQDLTLNYDNAPSLTEATGTVAPANTLGWSDSGITEADATAAATALGTAHDDAGTLAEATASAAANNSGASADAADIEATGTGAANPLAGSADATLTEASATGAAVALAAIPPLTEATASGSASDLTANYDALVSLASATGSAAGTDLAASADAQLTSAIGSATSAGLTASSDSGLTTATGALAASGLAGSADAGVSTALVVGAANPVSEPVSVIATLIEATAGVLAADLSYLVRRPWPPRGDVHLRYDVVPNAAAVTTSVMTESDLVI